MASEVDDITAFLRQQGHQQFCGACLAFEFKLAFQSVDGALAAVGPAGPPHGLRGQCAVCDRRALVTGLEPGHEQGNEVGRARLGLLQRFTSSLGAARKRKPTA